MDTALFFSFLFSCLYYWLQVQLAFAVLLSTMAAKCWQVNLAFLGNFYRFKLEKNYF